MILDNKRVQALQEGLHFKQNKDAFPGVTWSILNEQLGKPFATGESLRVQVNKFAKLVNISDLSRKKSPNIKEKVLDNEPLTEVEIIEKEKNTLLSNLAGGVNASFNQYVKYNTIRDLVVDTLQTPLPRREVIKSKVTEDDREVAIYCVADLHYDKVVNIARNKYNKEIATERLLTYATKIVKDVQANKHKDVLIAFLGDDVEGSGNLRTSQWLSNTLTIMQQTQEVMALYDTFIKFILDSLKGVCVTIPFITHSNHGQLRLNGSGRSEVPDDDVGIVIGGYLKRLYPDVVKAANEIVYELFDYPILFTHGHDFVKSKSLFTDICKKYNQWFLAIIAGHFHSFSIKSKGLDEKKRERNLLYCPSIVGTDDYSERNGWTSSPLGIKFTFTRRGLSTVKKFELDLNEE